MGIKRVLRKGVQLLERMLSETNDELREIEILIMDWKNSKYRKEQITGELYYCGEHDILKAKRQVIGKSGELEEVKNLPNNKIVDNQYRIHISKKANYLFGRPISVESKDERYASEYRRLINHKFMNLMRSICTDSMNQKIGWIYVYYSDDGSLRFKKFMPFEILPIWTDSCHDELQKVIRVYEQVAYEDGALVVNEKVEIYDRNGVRKYDLINNRLYHETKSPYVRVLMLSDGEIKGEQHYNWNRIPIIPFKYDEKEISLITTVKSLQDGINRMLSTFQNNMEEDSRNTILVLVNYDGENLAEFREKLQKYGAVKVRSENGGNGDLKTLQVEVKASNYQAIVDIFKKALIQNMRSSDTTELRSQSGGSPNQMNIQSIYSDMDNDANAMETSIQASFDDLKWFIDSYLSQKGITSNEELKFVLNRDMLQDEALIISSMQQLGVKVSNRTLLGQLPFINDIDKEMEQINEESEKEKEEDYATILNNPKVIPNEPE